MIKRSEQFPLARKEDVLVERLSDEVLVYDLVRKKAHCLNQAAAVIWDHCDGKTGVEEIAKILRAKLNVPVDEETVWFGLREIGRNHLLENQVLPSNSRVRISRRELIRRVGLAVSVPLVLSVLAPTASASLSCSGGFCSSPGPTCVAPCVCIANSCQ
jgi:Coenzyme PQQ synthesis protein D (PqqD)